ncbi:hypothetical protein ACFL4L_06715 [bacterium]
MKEIIDCNRFLLKDGRIIQMVNVDTPSLSDTNRTARHVIPKIMEYLKKEVKGVSLRAEFVDSLEKEQAWLVHLHRKYDLNSVNINEDFLVRGFGYYEKDPVTSYAEAYFFAAQKAYQKNSGVWFEKKDLRPKLNTMDQRWRIYGGWAFNGEKSVSEENKGIPVVTFGYRVSKLLPLKQNKHEYVSLSCGFESFFFLINNVYVGAEFRRHRSFYLAYHYGSFFLLPLWHDSFDAFAVYHGVYVGYVFPGKHFELESGINFLEEGDRLVRVGLSVTQP